MPKATPSQRRTVGRVMHEYKHGELKSGPGGKAGKVKNPRQAIAIALSESGTSKFKSEKKNQRSFARSRQKEATGRTAQQEKEGKRKIGARGERESTPAMGGKNATRTTAAGRKAARTRARNAPSTKAELYERATKKGIQGRSRMTKQQLANALR
jgi:hypothetical protein